MTTKTVCDNCENTLTPGEDRYKLTQIKGLGIESSKYDLCVPCAYAELPFLTKPDDEVHR
jgi:hypothetical protein